MIINKFAKWMLCAGLAAAAGTVEAGPIEFDFKDITEENLLKYAPKIVDGVQQIINFAKKYA